MNKFVIICPYFGDFPSNIEITFNSMNNNGFIDWMIFTDNVGLKVKYKNVKIISYTFEKFKKLVKNRIGTDVKSIYKICDYKPTFGYLFEEYIENYSYWGFCDLDVVFGDLKKFFSEEKLKKFDKIYDLGHLTIIKNCKETREAFKEFNINSKDYKTFLNSKYIFILDETYDNNHQGINGILKSMGYRIYEERNEYADISIKFNNFYPYHIDNFKYYYLIYENECLYLKKYKQDNFAKELAYVHLQQKKNIPVLCKNYNHFMILPKGFFNIQCIEKSMFYKSNYRVLKYMKYRLLKKIKNIKRNKEIGFHW